MPTIETSIEFEAFCAVCKKGICANFEYRTSMNRGAHQFTVEPCERCLGDAKQEGLEEGHEKGLRDAPECDLEHTS